MPKSLNQVLIPIDVSEPLSLGGTLIETLPLAKPVLLGYWQIPDQTQSDQARDQFEAEAQQRLQAVAKRFTDQGVDLQTRLVFTNDRDQSIDTATNEYGCQSVLFPGTESPPSGTTRGIVLIKPDADLDRIAETLGHCSPRAMWNSPSFTPSRVRTNTCTTQQSTCFVDLWIGSAK